MTRLESQIMELSPSVKDALYRRLMFADDLAWLRNEKKKDKVIGFEVDLDGQELPGFALIAIQRHTVIAYVSDRDENPCLILFPTLETLFDPGFELLDLMVTKKEFSDAGFHGVSLGHGRFGDMVRDLTPPNRKMDLAETVIKQMAAIIQQTEEPSPEKQEPVKKPQAHLKKEPIVEPDKNPEYEEEPPEDFYEEPPEDFDSYEEPDDFDSYEEPGYEDYETGTKEPEPALSRSEQLKAQTFDTLNEVIDFTVMKLGINRPLAVTLANRAMQSQVSPEYRVQLAVNIFCKLMDEEKI